MTTTTPDSVTSIAPDLLAERVLGALVDFPALLDDPEVAAALEQVGGEARGVLDALRECDLQAERASLDEARVSKRWASFLQSRAGSPAYETSDAAKDELVANAVKIRRRALTAELRADVQRSAEVTGGQDEDEAFAFLQQLTEKARVKRQAQTAREAGIVPAEGPPAPRPRPRPAPSPEAGERREVAVKPYDPYGDEGRERQRAYVRETRRVLTAGALAGLSGLEHLEPAAAAARALDIAEAARKALVQLEASDPYGTAGDATETGRAGGRTPDPSRR